MKFQQYLENIGNVSSESKDAIREITRITNTTIDNTRRNNGYGINHLNFEVINEERAKEGIQINFEVTGSANARDKLHVVSLLKRLMSDMRETLWREKIFLEIMYHKIDLDYKHQYQPHRNGDELKFTTIAAAIVFS